MNMSGPSGVADIFAAVMLLVAAYSAARLAASRLWARPVHLEVDVSHLLMGVAMAGMFVAALNPIPTVVWEVVFSFEMAWFVWRIAASLAGHERHHMSEEHRHHVSHYPTHVVMASAMLYMYLAPMPATGRAMAMAGATGARADFLGLPLLFLFILTLSGIWELDRADRIWRARAVRAELPTVAERTPSLVLAGSPSATSLVAGSTFFDAEKSEAQREIGERKGMIAPGSMAASHVAMCIAMTYMLVLML